MSATAPPGGTYHVAIDLGAGSGRAMLGRLDSQGLHLEETHRFRYAPAHRDGHLRWSFASILAGLKEGLQASQRIAAERGARLETAGVDSWGVDYGLLDAAGRLLEDPVCYRDHRTDGAMERVLSKVARSEIFDRTGIQFLQFNTLLQLHEHVREGLPAGARRLLLIPDLCHHALCASTTGEYTNASTTQLLDVRTRRWADDLFSRLDLPRELVPEIVSPGTTLGEITPSLRKEMALPPLRVVAPATHDTGSAVAGIPLQAGWAYISSGTWSLVGVERAAPLVNEVVERANFTNEGGVFGTIRFLKNVMGLWILDSCRREWAEKGLPVDLRSLLPQAAAPEPSPGLVFPDHPRFFNPVSMTAEVQKALAETGQSVTEDPALLARVILDSLALRYASVVSAIEQLTGEAVPGIHVGGGGCLNEYLNQATADAAGKPVRAGPAEATACGNLLMQAVAFDRLASLAEGRRVVREAVRPRLFEPRPGSPSAAALERYREIEARSAGPV
jgi:rhamnulokinase